MIKAIIIDDEKYCCETISILLENLPEVAVVAVCYNAKDALAAIRQYTPDLLFLDVEMPKMNGFEMLEQLSSVNFDIIFTTSYNHYAIKAIRFSAIDYLLKPVDEEELKYAVQKVIQRSQKTIPEQFEVLLQKINQPSTPINKIALPTLEGFQMIKIDSIISCESDSNYTTLRLKNDRKIIVCRNLKDLEDLLEEHSFARVHRSYLVNLNEIEKFIKGDGGYLIMSDGSKVDVSRNKKEDLLKRLTRDNE
jgi:two-component system LytT family response regulator